MDYTFHFEVMHAYWPWLAKGLGMTLLLSIIAMIFALLIGLVMAIFRLTPSKPLQLFARVYIEFFRGIPMLVFIIWLYYGIAMVVGINFRPLVAGVICLSMQHGGYLAEIYRSGIQAIPRGQWEAAYSLGYSSAGTFIKIIMPQAIKIIIPPTANMFIGMLKDSALVSVIGVNELMRQSQISVSLSFRPFEIYTVAALLYITLTLGFSQIVKVIESRMKS